MLVRSRNTSIILLVCSLLCVGNQTAFAATFAGRPLVDVLLELRSNGLRIVFTSNVTEAINLLAASYGRAHFAAGDEVVVSHMEHHANIVPWQLLEQQIGIKLRVAPIDDRGDLLLEEYEIFFDAADIIGHEGEWTF